VGAGRSVLADKNGVLIAGNKTFEAAAQIGIDEIIEVEASGNQLVVVKRTDLDINSAEGVKMKILDNTVSKHNYVEDAEVAEAICEEYDLNGKEYGLPMDAGNSDNLEEDENRFPQFVLKIVCDNEQQCKDLYQRFNEQGLDVKICDR
jgi:hypothetical protein